jgi:hypothetical protein
MLSTRPEKKKGRENESEREQTKLFVAGRLLHVVILPGSHFSVAERKKSPDARPGLRAGRRDVSPSSARDRPEPIPKQGRRQECPAMSAVFWRRKE